MSIPRGRAVVITFIVILLFSCSKPAEKPVEARKENAQPVVAASAIPVAQPQPMVDAHAAEYEEAKNLIRDWDGDGAKLVKARAILTGILAKDKSYAPAYEALARIEYKSGYYSGDDYDSTSLNRGWKLVQHALKLDPNLFDAHLTAGMISRYQGELDSARTSFDRAEELQPGSAEVKLCRAELAEAERNVTELARWANAVLAGPSNDRQKAAAYGFLVTVYRQGGHADQMDEAYRAQIRLEPKSAWIRGNYAGFLLDRGQVDESIREAEAAVRIMPYPIAKRTLAQALLTKADEHWNAGRFREAAKTIERIAALAGDHPAVYAGMGSYYERAAIRSKDPSMRQQALQWYEKALALVPEDRDLQKAVSRLRARAE